MLCNFRESISANAREYSVNKLVTLYSNRLRWFAEGELASFPLGLSRLNSISPLIQRRIVRSQDAIQVVQTNLDLALGGCSSAPSIMSDDSWISFLPANHAHGVKPSIGFFL